MPLPPAPNKRAALLAPEAYDLKSATKTRSNPLTMTPSRRSRTAAPRHPRRHRPAGRAQRTGSHAQKHGDFGAGHRTTPCLNRFADVARPQPATCAGRTRSPVVAKGHPSDRSRRKSASTPLAPARLFVLDTNVLLHDPMSLFRFEEHDIFLPMIVLEELDGHKKGMTEVARNGRQTSRTLDALAAQTGGDMAKGLKLAATGHQAARGLLYLPDRAAGRPAAHQPAARQGRQPDPGRGAGPARQVPAARSHSGVQGHQHARQGPRAGPGRRRLPERQDPGRRRTAVLGRPCPAAGLLDPSEQDHRKLAERQPHPSTGSAARR